MSMTGRCRRLAIIGAGFTGTALTLELLRHRARGIEIFLIDKRGSFGPGLAYSTRSPHHLLNVCAAKMSLFEDEPRHFAAWLAANHSGGADLVPGALDQAFAPRALYGRYLVATLEDALAELPDGQRVERIAGEVTALGGGDGDVECRLADGRRLVVDSAVLCLGNAPPAPLAWCAGLSTDSPRVIQDPWAPGALDAIAADDAVVMIGTGLTMVDIALSLVDGGCRASLTAISRHGLVPQTHAAPLAALAQRHVALPPQRASDQLRWLREEIARAARLGADWRCAIDTLRPQLQSFWSALPSTERQRFLRHLRHYWDIHRHRMAPSIGARIAALRASGGLRIIAGRVRGAESAGDAIELSIVARGSADTTALRAAWVINCTGPARYDARGQSALLRHLFERGMARTDPLGMGLDVGFDGRLIDRDGRLSPRLYALGPPTRGTFWEITAVPEIRQQCAALARTLTRTATAPGKALRRTQPAAANPLPALR